MPEVVIPYAPRDVFLPFHNRPQRWGVIVAHRRAGKTVACINELIKRAVTCTKRDPRFAYVAPYYAQAKDVAWNYLKRFALVIPGATANEAELRVDFANGGRVRLYGADNYDRMRGIYLDGVINDEYGDQDPRAWKEVIRPALSDRQGWGVFIGTPKGQNHFAELWDDAVKDGWFTTMLKASQTEILPEEELADARRQLTPEQYNQEYECSFHGSVIGAYYAREFDYLDANDRLRPVAWEPSVAVHTAWDLGVGDSTAVWFVQCVGGEVRVVDFLENNSVGLPWYVNELKSRPYTYGTHILPHDVDVKELGTGLSRLETLRSLGVFNTHVLPRQPVDDGINAARMLLPKVWFDKDKTALGLKALRNYRREWDDKRKVFNDRPLHDWSSHAADAFRYLAMGLPNVSGGTTKPIQYRTKVVA